MEGTTLETIARGPAAFAGLRLVASPMQPGPGWLQVQTALESMPIRRRMLAAALVDTSYHQLPPERLPLALAELQRVLEVGAPVELVVPSGAAQAVAGPADHVPGRLHAAWSLDHLMAVVAGAGFEAASVHPGDSRHVRLVAQVSRTLPDTVGPGMRLLTCGLNPSLYAADVGVPFARPGNRFWPAMLAAGLASVDRDPGHTLRHHRVGMTDLVKRASVGATEIRASEYRQGLSRVERLCHWLRPRAMCFIGLAGWRAAVDTNAVPGPQPTRLADTPVYLMPSTSGRNAHAGLEELTTHLRAAATLVA